MGATTLGLAVGLLAPAASANPMVMCFVQEATETSAQTVHVLVEVDPRVAPGTIELYRAPPGGVPDPNRADAVLVGELPSSGTPSEADTGSGFVATMLVAFDDDCVPEGTWQYITSAYCGSSPVQVTGTDEACHPSATEEDDGGGCAVAPPDRVTGGWLLVGLGALLLLRRRPP